jgi:hypothetical protein
VSADRDLSVEAVSRLALVARLDLSGGRAELVRGMVEHFYAVMDKLDEMDLSEESPASTYDPRWT